MHFNSHCINLSCHSFILQSKMIKLLKIFDPTVSSIDIKSLKCIWGIQTEPTRQVLKNQIETWIHSWSWNNSAQRQQVLNGALACVESFTHLSSSLVILSCVNINWHFISMLQLSLNLMTWNMLVPGNWSITRRWCVSSDRCFDSSWLGGSLQTTQPINRFVMPGY